MSHGVPIDGPAESIRSTGSRFRRQHGRAPDADLVIVADRDGRRFWIRQVELTRVGTPGLVGHFQVIVPCFQILKDQETATETLLVDDPGCRAQLYVPRPLGCGLGNVEGDGAIGDQTGGISVVGRVLESGNDEDGVRRSTILEADWLHEGDVLRRGSIEGVHRRLGTVGVGQVVGRLPVPGEATGILATAHTPTDLLVKSAGIATHTAIGREEHRETTIRVGRGHGGLWVVARQVHQ